MIGSVLISIAAAGSIVAGPLTQAQQPQPDLAPSSASVTASTSAKGGIRTPGTCRGKGLGVRPRRIRFICVRDAHFGGQKLRWRKWGGRKAVAVGYDSYAWPSTASPTRLWKARFVLSRPRVVLSKRIYTRLKVTAKEPVFWGAKRHRGVSRVERFHAVYRQTEGVPAPCVFQWVNPKYTNGPLICKTKPSGSPNPGTSEPAPTAPPIPPTPGPQPAPVPPPVPPPPA